MLAVGGVLLLALLRAELIDTADDAGTDTATSVADLAQEGILPPVLAATEEIATAVQVVKRGEVISATTNAVGAPAFLLDELRTRRDAHDRPEDALLRRGRPVPGHLARHRDPHR